MTNVIAWSDLSQEEKQQLSAAASYAARQQEGINVEAPITIVREYNGGHYTVRAASPAIALALLAELERGFPGAPAPAPSAQPASSSAAQQPANGGDKCPVHQKARLGRWGVHCPAKNEDGSYCQWKADAA